MRRLADAQIRRQQQISDLRGRAGASQDRQRRSQLEVAAHESSRVALDEQEMLRAFQQTKDRYRRLSMQQTATVLTLTDEHDDLVYRLISLWFSIASPESLDQVHRDESDKLHKEFRQLLKNITSSKFVFLAPQLTARLSKQAQKDSVHFRKGLSSLVERLSRDHPYHLLYLLYNLRYSSSAKSASNKKSKRSSSTLGSDSVAQAARVKAAEDVINSLKANTQFKDRLELVDMACEAYHEWANYDPTSEGEKKRRPEGYLPLPRSLSIAKLQSVPLPVSTYHLPVEPSGRYETSTLPTIVRYHEQFKIAGGINRPKISDCIGSDGRRYKQLVSFSKIYGLLFLADFCCCTSSKEETIRAKTPLWNRSSA